MNQQVNQDGVIQSLSLTYQNEKDEPPRVTKWDVHIQVGGLWFHTEVDTNNKSTL